jgi:hypothetical protein
MPIGDYQTLSEPRKVPDRAAPETWPGAASRYSHVLPAFLRDADRHSAACHVHGVFFGCSLSQTVRGAREPAAELWHSKPWFCSLMLCA